MPGPKSKLKSSKMLCLPPSRSSLLHDITLLLTSYPGGIHLEKQFDEFYAKRFARPPPTKMALDRALQVGKDFVVRQGWIYPQRKEEQTLGKWFSEEGKWSAKEDDTNSKELERIERKRIELVEEFNRQRLENKKRLAKWEAPKEKKEPEPVDVLDPELSSDSDVDPFAPDLTKRRASRKPLQTGEGLMARGERVPDPSLKKYESQCLAFRVTAAVSPGRFYCQIAEPLEERDLLYMEQSLKKYYGKKGEDKALFVSKRDLGPGLMAAVKQEKAGGRVVRWSRVMVLSSPILGAVDVHFIDRGTTGKVTINTVRYLHRRFGSQPGLSVECGLFSVVPEGHRDWSEAASDRFRYLVSKSFDRPHVGLVMEVDVAGQHLELMLLDPYDCTGPTGRCLNHEVVEVVEEAVAKKSKVEKGKSLAEWMHSAVKRKIKEVRSFGLEEADFPEVQSLNI